MKKFVLFSCFCIAARLSASTIDVSNDTTVFVGTGATLEVVFNYPSPALPGGVLPTDLFESMVGNPPPGSASSYDFAASLQSLDGNTRIALQPQQGIATVACLDFFCTQSIPIIEFIFTFSGTPGLNGIISPGGAPGQTAGELLLTNMGPGLTIGGVFPGQTLSQNLAITLGAAGVGSDDNVSVALITPEPATLLSIVIGLFFVSIATGIKRYRANSRV